MSKPHWHTAPPQANWLMQTRRGRQWVFLKHKPPRRLYPLALEKRPTDVLRVRTAQTERTQHATIDSGPGEPQTCVTFRHLGDGRIDLLVVFRPFPNKTFAAHDRSEVRVYE